LGAPCRNTSRYARRNAEHAVTAPRSSWSRSHPLIAFSHGSRSASVRGMPARIFSTLDFGWNPSPSMNAISNVVATARPIVVLPEPDTPMAITMGFLAVTLASLVVVFVAPPNRGGRQLEEAAAPSGPLPVGRAVKTRLSSSERSQHRWSSSERSERIETRWSAPRSRYWVSIPRLVPRRLLDHRRKAFGGYPRPSEETLAATRPAGLDTPTRCVLVRLQRGQGQFTGHLSTKSTG
jgi:hypothetical protein